MRRNYWTPAVLLAACVAAAFWVVLQCTSRARAKDADPPYGIPVRVAWTSGQVSGSPEAPPPFLTTRAYPKITFTYPLDIAFAPALGRVLVLEEHGKLFSFPNRDDAPRADLLLDLSHVRGLDKVPDCKGTGDAYGIVLHPQFAKNHYIYVCYTLDYNTQSRNHENGARVSRFTVSDTDPPTIDPASEVIILQWLGGGHDGGCLKFGPDGFLYISTGDAGDPAPPDPFNTGQDVSDLLSSVLRIDVDHPSDGKPYSVPKDNPFVKLAGARPEVWAYGLRNPWRMNFDRQTGNLWVGDVGWELWESIVCAKAGGNYGWSIMEGPNPVHPDGQRGPTPLVPPLAALPHTEADSITGGVVYRGRALPELVGNYLFGDWQTMSLWAAKCIGENQDKIEPYRLIAQTNQKIVAFGETPDGEPIIVDYGADAGGGLWRVVRNPDVGKPSHFPRKLSETGLFASTKDQTPAPGVIPYSVNAAQWVDGAAAQRWVAVTGTQAVSLGNDWLWGKDLPVWPKDSVLVRTLSLPIAGPAMAPATLPEPGIGSGSPPTAARSGPGTDSPNTPRPATDKKIETQLLHFDGQQWHAYSYAWNDQQTDADLVDTGGDVKKLSVADLSAPSGVRKQNWQFASRAQCMTCHNGWCNFALSFNAQELDRTQRFEDGTLDNQVRAFRHIGLLPEARPGGRGPRGEKPTLVDPADATADLSERARSYLHVNCSHCHRNAAGGSALFDVRKELPLERTHTIDVRPNLGDFGIADGKIICAGDPSRSVILYRMSKLGRERMPHIGSEIVDERGVELIRQWVASMPGGTAPLPPEASAARADHDAALRQLEDPAAKEADIAAAADKLLSSTGGALALICDIEAGRLTGQPRQAAVERGINSHQDLVHDLFRRFDPNDQQADRLGPNINPAKVLALTGDAERGRRVFQETAGGLCARCHRSTAGGIDFGPDLTHIATKYNRADLLDNILYPSKTITQGFATYLVKTKSGEVYTGLLVKQTEQEVVLKDASLKQTTVPAADLEKITPQAISAMPDGLLNDLTAQQAADLIGFLQTQK